MLTPCREECDVIEYYGTFVKRPGVPYRVSRLEIDLRLNYDTSWDFQVSDGDSTSSIFLSPNSMLSKFLSCLKEMES